MYSTPALPHEVPSGLRSLPLPLHHLDTRRPAFCAPDSRVELMLDAPYVPGTRHQTCSDQAVTTMSGVRQSVCPLVASRLYQVKWGQREYRRKKE